MPEGEERASKSERKREHKRLQQLAAHLAALSGRDIKQLPLSETTREQLAQAAGMAPSGARQRQLRYLARLLGDEDRDRLSAFLEGRDESSRRQAQRHKQLERLRDGLLDGGAAAQTELLAAHPELSAGELRQLCRDARGERDCGKPRGAARALFRYLRDTLKR